MKRLRLSVDAGSLLAGVVIGALLVSPVLSATVHPQVVLQPGDEVTIVAATPEVTPSPAPTATASPTTSPTSSPSDAGTPSPSPEPSSPAPSASGAPSTSPPSSSPATTPSPTPVPTPTATPTPSPQPTPSPTPSPTATPSPTPTASPSPSPSPTPEPTPTASATPPPPPSGNFIGPEVAGLPITGSAWTYLASQATGSWGSPALTTDQDARHNVKVLAGALYYAKTGDLAMRTKVRNALMAVVNAPLTRTDNAILSMGRQLGAYVLAADYIRLADLSGADGQAFRTWLSGLRHDEIGTHGRYKSLVGTALDSPHNWGTFALASLIAADIYMDDQVAVQRDWLVYQGYVNRAAYAGFESQSWGGWPCVGVPFTPANGGCPEDRSRFGAWPKDIVRGGSYPTTGGTGLSYTREIIQGVVVSAELLWKTGRTNAWPVLAAAWVWSRDHSVYNNHQTGFYTTWMVNERLGWSLPTNAAGYGRLFGYTDWLYGS